MVLRVPVPDGLVGGDVDEGYGPVADAFRRNFSERGEIGAACAMNRTGFRLYDDPREVALRDALYGAL